MQSKQHLRFTVMVVLCLLFLLYRILDLWFFTEPGTGYVTWGPAWLRYLPALLLAVGSYLAARGIPARPVALNQSNRPLFFLMSATGIFLILTGICCLPALLAIGSGVFAMLDALLPVMAGVWFVMFGWQALFPTTEEKDLPHAGIALLVLVFFGWLAIQRFVIAPASVVRLGNTFRVLSAAAALLFLVNLVKVFLVPGQPFGRSVFASGFNAFLLCGCCEFPQSVFDTLCGVSSLSGLALGIGMGCLGLCGLVCAKACTSEESPVPSESSSQPQ